MARKINGQKSLKASTRTARAAPSAKISANKTSANKTSAKSTTSTKAAKTTKSTKGAKPAKDPKAKEAKKASKAAPAKDAPPKKRRSKAGVVRLKAFWGVFNQMMKRVHVFEYAERRQADKKAAELSTSAKSPHFVQLVKEVIREAE